VDLYLIHWPFQFVEGPMRKDANGAPEVDNSFTISDPWKALDQLLTDGRAKSIGVANFNIPRLKNLIEKANVIPTVNQVELHPYWPQWELLEFCNKHNIHVTAYSPLGSTDAPLEMIQY